jgi:hypothetical protein
MAVVVGLVPATLNRPSSRDYLSFGSIILT